MPMMPFIGVRISWLMLARNSLLARLASMALSRAITRSVLVARSSAVRCFDGALELFLVLDQLGIPILDLDEHLVEPVNQLADLVVTGPLDAHIVAMLARDCARGRGQPQERLGNDSLQPGRQRERQPKAQRSGRPRIRRCWPPRARISSRSDST